MMQATAKETPTENSVGDGAVAGAGEDIGEGEAEASGLADTADGASAPQADPAAPPPTPADPFPAGTRFVLIAAQVPAEVL